jgi:uncharacterized membrane protein
MTIPSHLLSFAHRMGHADASSVPEPERMKGSFATVDRFMRAIPALYLTWGLPFLLALVILVPPWQHPDEPEHFLRTAQVADGELFSQRWGATAGGLSDPAVAGAVLPFNSVPFHTELKVDAPMYASAHRFRWSTAREVTSFPHTAIYPPLLYAPGVLAVWVGRAANFTVVQTLYLARAANALASALVTFGALVLARRSRAALAVVAILPMTVALYASASKDALTISLVLLAVGAIDRIINERRAATRSETLMIAIALLFPALARPPYVLLSGLLLLTASSKSLRPWLAGGAVIICSAIWWIYAARTSMVELPPGDSSAQIALSVANPTHAVVVFWRTLLHRWSEIGEEMIGVLGWLDTRLPLPLIQLATVVLLLSLLAASAGPARKPWLPLILIGAGLVAIFLAIYVTFSPPGAPTVDTLQGRLFLPLAALLPLALPQVPSFGTRMVPWAAAGIAILALLEPALVIRVLAVRYYLPLS